MKKDAMAAKWKEVLESQKDAPIFSKWSAADEINLAKLTSQPITLADTALGRHQQTIKRQVNNVITKMSQDERDKLRKKLNQMDEMDEDKHSPLISVMPNLACKNSPTKPEVHPTHDSREINSNEGTNEAMM